MAMFMDETGTGYSLDAIDTPQSRRVESTVLVDLRGSPRVESSFPAKVQPYGKPAVLVMVTNVSRSGLRAEGCKELIDTLFDGKVQLENHEHVVARFSLEVMDADGNVQQVVVQGRTVYARPDNGRFQVGVEFIEFEKGRDVLFDYLASRGVRK